MTFVLLALVGLLTVPLTGGRLSRLGQLELRRGWVALLALALQVAIMGIAAGGSRPLHVAIYLLSYVLAGVFVAANRRLPGLAVLAAGALANAAVIAINGGVMPASASAQRLAGLRTGAGFQNSAHLAHPHLLWLGDVIPLPGPWPLGNVLSLGDCLIFVGLLILLHRVCRGEAEPAPVHA